MSVAMVFLETIYDLGSSNVSNGVLVPYSGDIESRIILFATGVFSIEECKVFLLY